MMDDLSLNACSLIEPYEDENDTDTYIDNITLKLLMNKQKYQKYREHASSTNQYKNKQYTHDLHTYKCKIINLTNELLNEPLTEISNDVNDAFEEYSKCLIRHFKMEAVQSDDTSDSDTMFDEIKQAPDTLPEKDQAQVDAVNAYFWGNIITKKS